MIHKKKILIIMTNITTRNMQLYLQQLGYEVVPWMAPVEGDMDKCAEALSEMLDESYYAVFMYNFYPEFAQACYDKKIFYITWVVDNPHFSLYSDTARYTTNRIFVFDRSQCAELEKRGLEKVFYLPLGADIDFFQKADDSRKAFCADVSFVGSLYNENKRNLFQQITYLPPYVAGYLNALLQSQQKVSNNIIRRDTLTAKVWEEIKQHVNLMYTDEFAFAYEDCFVSILQKEVTKRERCQAVTLLNQFFDFKLYSGSPTAFNPQIKKGGYVNYETEMPLVFRQSRVNLNITLRSITSGIPLRALDIMACRGFLLSNYQPELVEYFEEGKECAFFYDLEDMVIKTDYYLKHEEERQRIVEAGYRKVAKEFSLKGQLGKMQLVLEAQE